MKCPKCNNEITDESGICSYCKNKSTNFLQKLVIMAIMVFIFFIVCMYTIINKYNNRINDEYGKIYGTSCKNYCNGSNYEVNAVKCMCSDGRVIKHTDIGKDEKIESKYNNDLKYEVVKYDNFDLNVWYNDVKSENLVINVISASYSEYCNSYLPIAESVTKEKNIKLYFIDIDMLSYDDAETFTKKFELSNYDGHIPFTFVTYGGEVIDDVTGKLDEEDLINFIDKIMKQS